VTPVHLPAVVLVLVQGAFVSSAPPAMLAGGHVIAPIQLVARFADRVEARDGIVRISRGSRTCAVRALTATAPVLIALAPLARCLGAAVAWDGRAKTFAIAFAGEFTIRPLPTFDPTAPQVAPTTVFTPEPPPPAPRTIDSASPRPRRTAIPVVPSWPLASTAPRP
jgi:hypothetical protein